MATPELRHCPKCGAPLRADTGDASCPACAMRGAFAEEDPNAECGMQNAESPSGASASPSTGGDGRGLSRHSVPATVDEDERSFVSDSALHTPHSALGKRFGDYELLEE